MRTQLLLLRSPSMTEQDFYEACGLLRGRLMVKSELELLVTLGGQQAQALQLQLNTMNASLPDELTAVFGMATSLHGEALLSPALQDLVWAAR